MPDPVLVVSRTSEGLALRRLEYEIAKKHCNLQIERRPGAQRGSYIVSVEGVDVFGENFPTGQAWLFSARALQCIRYTALNALDRYVEVDFELADDLTGRLQARFRQQITWADTPIFELRTVNRAT